MLRALLKTMRPKQWAKNGFLFVALFFDRQLIQVGSLARTFTGFVLFCLLSSTVYIINDILDLEADRHHPTKRLRPIAAGELPVRTAKIAAIVMLLAVMPLAFWLSPYFGAIAAIYLVANLAYSMWIKHIPVIDVIVLAFMYVLRVGAGAELIQVTRFSPWLYVFTVFLALFLGVGKRRAELNLLGEDGNASRKVLQGYTVPLLDQLITIVSTLTIITYSLYTFSAEKLPPNHSMMLTIPFVIYGIFRYLYMVQVEHKGGAPEEALFSDRPLQVTLALFGLSILLILYVFPSGS